MHKCRKTTVNFDKSVLEIGHPRAVEVELKKVSVTTKKKPKTAAKKEPTTGGGDKGSARK